MKRLKKYLIRIALIVSVLFVTIWFSVPGIVRYVLAKKAPGVTINGSIDWPYGVLGGGFVSLNDIQLDTDTVKGSVDVLRVKLKWVGYKPVPTDIQVEGGSLSITAPTKSKKKVETKGPSIIDAVSLISLTKVKVSHPKGNADGTNIQCKRDPHLTCLVSNVKANVKGLPLHELSATNVEYTLGFDNASAESVQAKLVNIDLPGVDADKLKLVMRDLMIDTRNETIQAGSAKLGDIGMVSGLFIGLQDRITISAESLTSKHPWFSGKSTNIKGWYCHNDECDVPEGEFNLDLPGVNLNGNVKDLKLSSNGDCQAWTDIAFGADPLRSSTSDMFKDSSISFTVDAKAFDVKLENKCKAKCDTELFNNIKGGKFRYMMHNPDGTEGELRDSGFKTSSWATASLMSPQARQAFIQLEDPSFRKHKGVLLPSLRSAFKQNMKLGKMHIGGSTITQQLAKNIWLTRDKTVIRKVREALISFAIEGCFSKDEILELYLNVVEFGPDVYGISHGAVHHFNKSFVDLTEAEAFYLASILPRPNNARPPGDLSRTLGLIERLKEHGFLKVDENKEE